MVNRFLFKLVSKLVLFLFFILLSFPSQAHPALKKAKEVYGEIKNLPLKNESEKIKAIEKFQNAFGFDDFFYLVIQDITFLMNEKEKSEVKDVFYDLFFENFKNKSENIFKKRVYSETYHFLGKSHDVYQISLTGKSDSSSHTLVFYFKEKQNNEIKLIDIEIDSALLSRNYRGTFNRTFRKHGFTGLKERLTNKLKQLQGNQHARNSF